jgi:hypothetical protein
VDLRTGSDLRTETQRGRHGREQEVDDELGGGGGGGTSGRAKSGGGGQPCLSNCWERGSWVGEDMLKILLRVVFDVK